MEFSGKILELEKMVEAVKNDPSVKGKYGRIINVSKLKKETVQIIENLGIKNPYYVAVDKSDCELGVALEIQFSGNLTLEYRCNHGVSKYKTGFLEFYPINQNWFLWINRDFIG